MSSKLNDLAERYAKLSNSQLLEILEHKEEYTTEAIIVLQNEIDKRKLGEHEIEQITTEKKIKSIIAEEKASISLVLWEKLFFYFIWFLPSFINAAIGMNYLKDGLLTKLQQSRFFRIAGFVSMLALTFTELTLESRDFIIIISLLFIFFGISYWIDKVVRNRIKSKKL
jgi:hypothetical protein